MKKANSFIFTKKLNSLKPQSQPPRLVRLGEKKVLKSHAAVPFRVTREYQYVHVCLSWAPARIEKESTELSRCVNGRLATPHCRTLGVGRGGATIVHLTIHRYICPISLSFHLSILSLSICSLFLSVLSVYLLSLYSFIYVFPFYLCIIFLFLSILTVNPFALSHYFLC